MFGTGRRYDPQGFGMISINRNPITKLSLFTQADQPVTLYSIKKLSQPDKSADQSITLFRPEKFLNFITKQHFFEETFNVTCLYTLNPFAINLFSSLFTKPIVNYRFQLNRGE